MNLKKQKSQKITISMKIILIPSILFIFSNLLLAGKFTVIKNPKATFIEKNYVMLKKVNQIEDTIDQEDFLAFTEALTVDNKGNIFVFDTAQAKIFKYDRNLNFVKSYGQKGQGPGDFMVPSRGIPVGLYSKNGNLYVHIGASKQLIVMDLNLNYIDEFRLKEAYLNQYFAVNNNENFWFYSPKGEGNILSLDNKMKLKLKFSIDLRLFEFLFFEPPKCLIENRANRRLMPIKHDIANDSQLIVYSLDTSTVFIFKNDRLENRFNLYSQKILVDYKERLIKLKKEESKSKKRKIGRMKYLCGYASPFVNFFIDKDTEKSIYLVYRNIKENKICLYNFDFEGKLIKINLLKNNFKSQSCPIFQVKRNNLFYAIDNKANIITYKEEKK